MSSLTIDEALELTQKKELSIKNVIHSNSTSSLSHVVTTSLIFHMKHITFTSIEPLDNNLSSLMNETTNLKLCYFKGQRV